VFIKSESSKRLSEQSERRREVRMPASGVLSLGNALE
jgi:hypothetical protein